MKQRQQNLLRSHHRRRCGRALIGLLFLSISIRIEVISASPDFRSRGAETLNLLLTVLLVAVLLGIPGQQVDHAGLSAWSQVQLGILALAQGHPEEARALLDEGLELSLATHSTRKVTLCLTAFAQLPARAAERLRQRVGLRGAWRGNGWAASSLVIRGSLPHGLAR